MAISDTIACAKKKPCDKENHGWREVPPVTVLCQVFDLPAGHLPAKSVSNENKNAALRRWPPAPSERFKTTIQNEPGGPHIRLLTREAAGRVRHSI